MSLAPSPSANRGVVTVQPSYFSSSLYVNPLREDIEDLIHIYSEKFLQGQTAQPFALFKLLWTSIGWTWIHLKVFDSRSRDSFMRITSRLFLGELRCGESIRLLSPFDRTRSGIGTSFDESDRPLWFLYTFQHSTMRASPSAIYPETCRYCNRFVRLLNCLQRSMRLFQINTCLCSRCRQSCSII